MFFIIMTEFNSLNASHGRNWLLNSISNSSKFNEITLQLQVEEIELIETKIIISAFF